MRADYSDRWTFGKDRLIRAVVLKLRRLTLVLVPAHPSHRPRRFRRDDVHTARLEIYTARWNGQEPAAPSSPPISQTIARLDIAYRDSTRFADDREYWAERVAGLEQGTSLAGVLPAPAPVNGCRKPRLTGDEPGALDDAVARATARRGRSDARGVRRLSGADDRQPMTSSSACRSPREPPRRCAAPAAWCPTSSRSALHVGHGTTVADCRCGGAVEVLGALRHQRYRHEDIRRDSPTSGTTPRNSSGRGSTSCCSQRACARRG